METITGSKVSIKKYSFASPSTRVLKFTTKCMLAHQIPSGYHLILVDIVLRSAYVIDS